MKYKHLFGPVPSRRLGVSLGIDLVPFKVCSLDCVYCECGKTDNLTVERKEYIPVVEIFDELNEYLDNYPDLDFITFSGSGEPTLHSRIGDIINFLKRNYSRYRIALLTNGTLLYQEKLRSEVKNVDLIMPSLDAVSESVFERVNRPHSSLDCRRIVSGLTELRKEYSGEIWLEIFIVPGLNDTKDELLSLKKAIQRINPDRVQLNTLDRPGTESWVMTARKEELEAISSYLGNAEIVTEFTSRRKITSFSKDIEGNILLTLKRRPCTSKDISHSLGLHLNEINKYLQLLLETDIIESEEQERGIFFKVKSSGQRE